MNRLAIRLAMPIVTALVALSFNTANAQCGCSNYGIFVPDVGGMGVHFIIETSDGPIGFVYVHQGGVPPVTGTVHKCLCATESGRTGPNDPPQQRACQYFDSPAEGSGDSSIVESAHCFWNPSPGAANCSMKGPPNSCPTL